MNPKLVEQQIRTARALAQERKSFMRDRYGHNGRGSPGRITFVGHGKGYVMARHPGCVPFVISEKDWRSLPYFG